MMTHHHLFSIRLPNTQRWILYLTLVMVALSGGLWTLLHDLLQSGWMLAERRVLIIHGVTAAMALIMIGSLLPLHVRLAWRVRRNLPSGIILLIAMTALAATGLGLYYGAEAWREWMRWTHIGTGIGGALLVPMHMWLGRRREIRSSSQLGSEADSTTKRVHA